MKILIKTTNQSERALLLKSIVFFTILYDVGFPPCVTNSVFFLFSFFFFFFFLLSFIFIYFFVYFLFYLFIYLFVFLTYTFVLLGRLILKIKQNTYTLNQKTNVCLKLHFSMFLQFSYDMAEIVFMF